MVGLHAHESGRDDRPAVGTGSDLCAPPSGVGVLAASESHLTQPLPQTEDGRHSAVGTLVGAGFKPALVPHARCNRIAVISRELKVGRTISGSTDTP